MVNFLKRAKNCDMTSINIVALPKKFSFMSWNFIWSILSPIHGHTYSKCILTIQGVPKMKNAEKWAKVEI